MNHLASAIYLLKLSENGTMPAMPLLEEKALADCLWFLKIAVKDLANLIEELPMVDWPLVQ